MDNNKEVEQEEENTAGADNEAMEVDNKAEAEKEMTGGGGEKELCNDSGNRSLEVDELNNGKEVEGNETVEDKPVKNGELGEVESNKSVKDVANNSSEEKCSVENPSANEITSVEEKGSAEDSVLVKDKDEKPEELSNGTAAMEVSEEDIAKKEESSNGLIPDELNDSKKETLKNEVKMAEVDDPKKGVTGRESVVSDGTKGEPATQVKEKLQKPETDRGLVVEVKTPIKSFLYDTDADGYESGTEEEQGAFIKELEVFHRERGLDFKPPKFYQEKLNLLKLWRSVIKLGGYEQVTSCKLWRQVGESFKPPKTCTTVSWTFRGFYEKSLLEYEKQKILSGELPEIDASFSGPMSAGTQAGLSQAPGSGRARRDAAARAMQGWHSMRLLSNGEVGDPIIKDKNPISLGKREKQLKSIGLLKRRKESPIEHSAKVGHPKSPKSQSDSMVVDIGPAADWVKINVQRTKDCFEVYALVPGLLREEVRVQSDPAGRLVISGQPEQLDNPWGVTPFKKVVTLPSRIDPHQTSAVVTLHGQLFVRVPFEQSDT